MGVIIDLEKESVLTSNVDVSDFLALDYRVFLVISKLEVQNCKDSVTSMVLQNNWSTRKMLIFCSPETNILSPTRD